jgi:ribosome assembly protein YihI (activator of Der GTPase)
MMHNLWIRFPVAVSALIVLTVSGCASVPRPDAELAQADASVKQAIEVGARTHAPLLLREAENKLNQAKASAAQKEYKQAVLLTQQAQADAELAEVTSLAAKAQMSVDELNQSIKILRQEMGLSP